MSPGLFGAVVILCVTLSYGQQEDYEFFESVNMKYKFHSIGKTWIEALKVCRLENATLAMPENEKEVSVLTGVFKYKMSSTNHTFIGFHDLFIENEYVTETGLPLQYFYHKWLPTEPNNLQNVEDCGAMHMTGFLNDMTCRLPEVFICQKKMTAYTSLRPNGYFPDVRGYILGADLGSLYKLHMNSKSWGEARNICQAEGGNLAIINSVAERDFLLKIFLDPDNRVLHVIQKDHVFLGFHDYFKEGEFFTVEGDSLESTGFTQWAKGQPENVNEVENCGTMDASGLLNDFSCAVPAVFICEKKVLIDNNFS